MGKVNDVLHRYFDDAARFADLYNGALFQSKPVINAGALSAAPEQYSEDKGNRMEWRNALQTIRCACIALMRRRTFLCLGRN